MSNAYTMNDYYQLIKMIQSPLASKIWHHRTGKTVYSMYGQQMRFRIDKDTVGQMPIYTLPLVTAKKVSIRNILEELNWFLRGSTNEMDLSKYGVNIWKHWANEDGELGPIYGKQWIDWDGVNQIEQTLRSLKKDPTSRRHIVSAWNVTDIPKMALPPCHMTFQFFVLPPSPDKHWGPSRLSMHLYQRSGDMFLGVPYNITSYSLLLIAYAKELGYDPHELIITIGDAHIYDDHMEAVRTMEKQVVFEDEDQLYCSYAPPMVSCSFDKNDDGYRQVQVEYITPYLEGPSIKAPVAV